MTQGRPSAILDLTLDFDLPVPRTPMVETPVSLSGAHAVKTSEQLTSVDSLQNKSSPVHRPMTSATLLGKQTHVTKNGIRVYIRLRRGAYIAKGRLNGGEFGPTLGDSVEEAEHALRRLLQELEEGTFRKASESKRKQPQRFASRIAVARVVNDFLAVKRSRLGTSTSRTYRARLAPLSEFAELPQTLRRWRAAEDVDEEFAVSYVDWLFEKPVHRNGHPHSERKLRSPDNVRRALETARAVFSYAKKKKLLPVDFENPFSDEIMPVASVKDPVRCNPTQIADRIRMVELMDEYELLHLMLPFVLGVRPEDFCSRLISDVDVSGRLLRFHSRFGGADFSKGRVDFALPLPEALLPLVRRLIDGRTEGPLLRRRAVWCADESTACRVESLSDVEALIDRRRIEASSNVRCGRDIKDIVHRVVRDLGGLSVDQLRDVYWKVRKRADLPRKRLYDLKHAVTMELTGSGVKQISATYLTGHRIPSRDIMARYDGVNPHEDVRPYFEYAEPLFDAMLRRGAELRLLGLSRESTCIDVGVAE